MDALLARSLQTMRGRFESLRPDGPIQALMADAPSGYQIADRGGLPAAYWFGGQKPCRIWHSGVEKDDGPAITRSVWLIGEHSAVDRFERACVDAAGFAPAVRQHFGLPRLLGPYNAQSRWVWTVFELAERGVAFCPLRLVKNAVFVAAETAPYIKAPEALVARAKASADPEGPDQILSALEFAPARYWELSDLIEASVMAMDLAEVAISAATKPPEPVPTDPGKKKNRGKLSARQILRAMLDEVDESGKPVGKLKIAAAGSAENLAAMIGKKSHSSVTELGDMWEREIKPLLETKKTIDRFHAAEKDGDRLGH